MRLFLSTKIFVPRRLEHLVARPALFSQLNV